MRNIIFLAGLVVLFGLFLMVPGLSVAVGSETTEAILDILHDRGDLSDEAYAELKRKAAKEERGFNTFFDRELHIDAADGRFRLQIGGRIMMDAGHISADERFEAAAAAAGSDFEGSGVEFRQTRLHMKGVVYDFFAFSNEFDLAAREISFQENWIEFQRLPFLGKMRIGHTKEPFSLERMNSRLHLTFMEQALPDGIVPGRNTGIRFLNFIEDLRMSWCLGFFKETDAGGDGFSESGDYNITGRLTVTPWYRDQGRQVLHLGLGYSHKTSDEFLRFRKRPETHLTDFQPVDSGNIPADAADMLGPEAALVWGPFCLQAEYWYARIDSNDYDDPELEGYYVAASCFLTGEHRKYLLKGNDGAEFGRPDILAPFDPGREKWGAWQVTARYAVVDLNDKPLYGGEMESITLALNGYLNANLGWNFNFVHVAVRNSLAQAGIDDAEADVFQTRLQISF